METKLPRGLGGTDAAAIAGLHPRKTALEVWRRLVEGHEVEQNRAMLRGTLLEPVIRELYRHDTGAELLGPVRLGHPQHDWFRASLDDRARRDGGERTVEYKSANIRMAHLWGEGSDEVPTEYLCQVQWYLYATKDPLADLAVLLGGDELRIYTLKSDLELQSLLVEAAEKFWRDHVLTKTPPPVDGSTACAEWLAERYPRNEGELLQANPEALRWVEQLRTAREAKAVAEEAEAEARNHLVSIIGAADGLQGDGWRVTHRMVKGREKTDWEAVAKAAGASPELIRQHTNRGAGYRRFLPTFKGEES